MSGLLALSALLLPTANVQAQGECGNLLSMGPVINPISGSKVIVGQTITITRFSASSANGNCLFRNGVAYYAHPDGNVVQTMSALSLDPGETKDCPADNGNGVVCMPFPTTYVVNAADINRTLTIVLPPRGDFGGGTSIQPGNANEVHFFGAGDVDGFNPGDPTSPTGAGQGQSFQRLIVVNPAITITKVCVNPCTPYGDPILFRGTICNTGDTPLINITVTDVPVANIVFAATKSNGQPFNPVTGLAAGECVDYTGSYDPADTGGTSLCGPFSDTVTVVGTAQGVFQNPTFTNSASATCHVSTSPSITLTKDCQPRTIIIGVGPQTYTETFVVCNTGNVPLSGVVINDSKVGAIAIGNLGIGQCVTNVQGPFTVTAADCPSATDRATATGNNICPPDATCPAPATVSSAEQTCTVQIQCPPRICVTKEVACVPASGTCDNSLPYGETASGVVGAAFCYKITVSNCGQDVLNNVVVNDPDLPGVAGAFPATLGLGDSVTAFFKKSDWPVGTHVNTVTANGVGALSGINVTTNDTATAILVPISVNCSIILHSDNDRDAQAQAGQPDDNHVTLSGSGQVRLTLTINNTGQADLDVAVTGLPSLVDCATGAPILVAPVRVAAGGSQTVVGCFNSSCPAGTPINVTVQGTAVASASIPCVFNGQGQAITTAASSCPASVDCIAPCIAITKECVNPCTPYGQPIQFRGTVSNTGDTPLSNITVSDIPAAVLVFSTTTAQGHPYPADGNPATAALAAGDSVTYTGSYSPPGSDAALCGPFTDTISVTAQVAGMTISNTDPCINPQTGVSTGPRPPVTATCHVQTTPSITLTKDCQPRTITIGVGPQTYTETFVVCNNGDVPLSGVVINDSKLGAIAIGNLGIGQCVTNVQGPFTVTAADCPSVTDRATATGNNICPPDATCPAPATVSSAEQTCTVQVLCPPQICVTKEVACVPASGTCDNSLPYAETATGVEGAAFCYRITVRNCGQDVLNNIVVSDPDLPGVAGAFPATLGIGDSVTAFFEKADWPVGTHVNTVTASGVGATSGINVTTNDTATAILVPIGVECEITLFSSFDMDNNTNDNHVTLGASGAIQFALTVRNTGQADLSVAIAGLPCSVDINGNPIPTTVTIPAGQTAAPIVCTADVLCPGTQFNITVTGTAVASATVPCVFDSEGNAITTAPSSCTASVNCVQPVTCRVTGGGVLNPGVVDQSCIPVETTILPFIVNGLTVRSITHGGQLGAPFSQMDCGERLGNPCIRGQWQHTRHYEGKGNPRDVIDMNFHNVNPKGQYDSLMCACLGCCDPETGAFIPPTVGPLIHKFQLCNPDDHKVCGPQPRPAPANVIIFSGIGRVIPTTDTGANGKAAEYVIFRVYIEDRSEPGGHHPNGAIEPSDIYCFQAWKTGVLASKKPNFSSVATAFRRALGQANCAFVAALESGALPIGSLPDPTVDGVTADIQDCGPLDRGNHQIHPSTSATCDE